MSYTSQEPLDDTKMGVGSLLVDEPVAKPRGVLNYWRVLRLVLAVQGLYYLITGFWPLLARIVAIPALPSAMHLQRDFPSTMVQALVALIGLILFLAAFRRQPDLMLVGLGLGAAITFFATEVQYRTSLSGLIYIDLIVEALFFLVLAFLYLTARVADRRRR